MQPERARVSGRASGGEPEIDDYLLDRVERYGQLLAVPARFEHGAEEVLRGKALFSEAGCTDCHTASHRTAEDAELEEVRDQLIWPYTDLLLHDMGDALGDDRKSFEASGNEWRTPPLWGLGRYSVVNDHERLLHDGRARGVAEAILWHGGEGAAAKDVFLQLLGGRTARPDRFCGVTVKGGKNRAAARALRFSGAALLVGAAACSSPGAPDTRRELLSSWSTELIVPLYRDFATESEALSTALGDLCASPTSESVTAARDAWARARETLKEGEVFAFGPYTRPEFRIGPTLDSWPARPDDVEELLASDSAVDAATVATLGVWHKGLPVIEYLLHPPDGVAEEKLADARRCEYLSSVGTELVSRARELHLAWSPEGGDFAGQLSGAGRTSTAFRSLRDAFGGNRQPHGFHHREHPAG